MIFTHRAKLNAKGIENQIEENAKSINLMLKHTYPFSANLPKKGFDIKEYATVYELCIGSLAAKLLNTQPELSILMPCRINVYEIKGECFVSTPDLGIQLEVLKCKDDLKKEILSLYDDMIAMIKKW